MDKIELSYLILRAIKSASFIPFEKGTLRDRAIYVVITDNGFDIVFNGNILKNITGVNYLPFLEEGTKPHLIPNAFGMGITVWHPGSTKHKDFIKKKSVNLINEILKQQGMEANIYVEYWGSGCIFRNIN